MSEINVVMVGPKGAGKTSILSVMLHNVQQFNERMCLHNQEFQSLAIRPSLEPEGMAHKSLDDGYGLLQGLAREAALTGTSTNYSIDVRKGMIMGDVTSRTTPVVFSMGRHETRINFWDFPGMFYSQKQIDDDRKRGDERQFAPEDVAQWEETVRNADVILLAVDTTTQLGKDPILKDDTYYARITKLVKDSIATSMTTLVFVPVKCEHIALAPKWNDNSESIALPFKKDGLAKLRKEVEELFPELMEHIRNPNVWGNVDAFFSPMITVGGVKCAGREFDPRSGKGKVKFSPILPEHFEASPFLPKNCDKVFALCLLRAYQPLVEEWKKDRTIPERIKAWWTGKTPFEDYFDKLADAIHFRKMFGGFFAENPSFLTSQGRGDLQPTLEEMSKDGPEDGCTTLNFVYPPMVK